MSDFNKYSYVNKRNQAELPTGADTTVRGSQLQRRNQSTYNPIGFDPSPQPVNNYEKERKKEQQQQYRDQLDQMVSGADARKASAKYEDYGKPYNPQPQTSSAEEQRRAEYERYQQAQYNASQEPTESYTRQAYGQAPSSQEYGYGQSQQQVQPQPSSQNQRFRQQTPTQNPINWQEPEVRQSNDAFGAFKKVSEEKNTFSQQDDLREQLLSKIRTGYSHPNSNVYNTYQKAHEQKEQHIRDFERNVVDKAAQERIIKEDQRAMTEWEKKKKLAWETNFSNKRALEEKAALKRKQQYDDMNADNRRVQDSLAEFERKELAEREKKNRLKEENNKVLEQQRKEYVHRNSRLYGDDIPGGPVYTTNQRYGHGLSPERREREKLPLERRQEDYNYQGSKPEHNYRDERAYQGEKDSLTSAMENLNVRGHPQGNDDYTQKYYQDQAYQQYAREMAEREASTQNQQYPRSLGDRELDAPYQYQREPEVHDNYARGNQAQSQQELRQSNPQYSPGKQSSAKADYLKIRDKARYGNNFNIISNEYR